MACCVSALGSEFEDEASMKNKAHTTAGIGLAYLRIGNHNWSKSQSSPDYQDVENHQMASQSALSEYWKGLNSARASFGIAILALALLMVGLIFPDVPGSASPGAAPPAAVSLAEDPSAALSVEDAAAGALEFQPLPSPRVSLGTSKSAFWMRVRVDNPGPDPDTRWLSAGIARLHHVSLFELHDGKWTAHHSGMAHPFAQRVAPTTTPAFALQLPARGSKEVYVRVAGETLLLLQPQVWEPKDFILAEAKRTRQEYFVAGITLLALLVCLLLAVILREASFLIFGLIALAYMLFRWSASGLAFGEFWPESPEWALRSIGFFTVALGFLVTLLHRHLFATRRRIPYADNVLRVLCLGFGILGVATLVDPNQNVMLAVMLWGLLASVFSPILGYLCWRRGAPLFGYFFAGYTLPLQLIELQYFASIGWLPSATGWLISYNRAWALVLSTTIVLIALGTRIASLHLAREASKRRQIDVLERTVAHRTSELRAANQVAQQALADQRQLLTMAAHEFRGPLANIGAAAQVLDLDCRPERRHMLERITRATARLKQFLDNCLTGERLATSHWTLQETRVDLPALQTIVEEMRRASPTHELRLVPACDASILADHALLRVLLNNLLENAIKYSPPGSAVELHLQRRSDGAVVLAVCDEGPGIAADDLPRLFDKFYRSERVGSVTGSGLGLYIAQRIARLHDGEIQVRKAPNGGACFEIVLPKERICP
jgi:two-component system, sensor histidine kinase LadS